MTVSTKRPIAAVAVTNFPQQATVLLPAACDKNRFQTPKKQTIWTIVK
jgi:hypothetical protein